MKKCVVLEMENKTDFETEKRLAIPLALADG